MPFDLRAKMTEIDAALIRYGELAVIGRQVEGGHAPWYLSFLTAVSYAIGDTPVEVAYSTVSSDGRSAHAFVLAGDLLVRVTITDIPESGATEDVEKHEVTVIPRRTLREIQIDATRTRWVSNSQRDVGLTVTAIYAEGDPITISGPGEGNWSIAPIIEALRNDLRSSVAATAVAEP